MAVKIAHGQSAEKCFLPGGAGFSGFLAQRSRTNNCQRLCQMGVGWNFCATIKSESNSPAICIDLLLPHFYKFLNLQLRTSARLFHPCRRGPYRDRLPR